jgi:hypothetical protein
MRGQADPSAIALILSYDEVFVPFEDLQVIGAHGNEAEA